MEKLFLGVKLSVHVTTNSSQRRQWQCFGQLVLLSYLTSISKSVFVCQKNLLKTVGTSSVMLEVKLFSHSEGRDYEHSRHAINIGFND